MLSQNKLSSAAGAASYYKADDYYSEKGSAPAIWIGQGAQTLGLSGPAKPEHFLAALEGRGPSGEALGRIGSGRTPGWDFTFSAPKSVSIMAVALKDKRLVSAQEDAVDTAIEFAERYFAGATLKAGGKRWIERTGNLLACRFTHTLSRKRDPQLHNHAVIINTTQAKSGKPYALDSRTIYDAYSAISLVYMNQLAKNAATLGYEIDRTDEAGNLKPYGNFELKGVPHALIRTLSKRSSDIEAHVADRENPSKRAKDVAALATRDKKTKINEKDLRSTWTQEMMPYKYSLREVHRAAKRGQRLDADRSQEALEFAIAHLSNSNSVFLLKDIYTEALQHACGDVSIEILQNGVNDKIASGELILGELQESLYVTSKEMAELEKRVSAQAKSLSQPIAPALSERAANQILSELSPSAKLSDQQHSAVMDILTARTGLMFVQGDAGTGKTRLLAAAEHALKSSDQNIIGLAPTHTAVSELKAVGIPARTVQSFMSDKEAKSLKNTVVVIDESSMIGTRMMSDLLDKFKDTAPAKIVFLGDGKQLPAIDPGNPFVRLQTRFHTRLLSDIKRQKDKTALKAAKLASAGKHIDALQTLSAYTIEAPREHLVDGALAAWSDVYEKTGDSPLVVTATHDWRRKITRSIREHLRGQGQLGEDVILNVNITKNLSPAQQQCSDYYAPGDHVAFISGQPSQGFKRGSEWKVTATDRRANQIELQDTSGKTKRLQLGRQGRQAKLAVSTEIELPFAAGDKIRFSRTTTSDGIQSNDTGIITDISNGEITLTMGQGNEQMRRLKIGLDSRAARSLDHAHAVTTHAAQGKSVNDVIVVIDTDKRKAISREQFYTQITRCKNSLYVITDNKEALAATLSRNDIPRSAQNFLGATTPLYLHHTPQEPSKEDTAGRDLEKTNDVPPEMPVRQKQRSRGYER